MSEWLAADDDQAPSRAAEVLRAGGLVILPTDTVYGVAADWRQPDAVAALYRAKGRPPDKAIPVLLADPDDISIVAREVPLAACRLADAFWPGPLTIAVPKRPDLPDIVSALPTVGVRLPDHDATRAVIRAMGGALAVTSANRSGQPSPLTAQEAAAALGETIALVLDGGSCPGGVPSTVVDVSEGRLQIVRAGPIDEAALRAALERSAGGAVK
jgi:L-threonylcarbamoyladenylate synthase